MEGNFLNRFKSLLETFWTFSLIVSKLHVQNMLAGCKWLLKNKQLQTHCFKLLYLPLRKNVQIHKTWGSTKSLWLKNHGTRRHPTEVPSNDRLFWMGVQKLARSKVRRNNCMWIIRQCIPVWKKDYIPYQMCTTLPHYLTSCHVCHILVILAISQLYLWLLYDIRLNYWLYDGLQVFNWLGYLLCRSDMKPNPEYLPGMPLLHF